MSKEKNKNQDIIIFASYEETKRILGFDDLKMSELLRTFNITSKIQYSVKQNEGFIDYLKRIKQDLTIDNKMFLDLTKSKLTKKAKEIIHTPEKQNLEELMKQRKELRKTSIAC